MWVFNPTTLKCTLKKSGNAWNPQILSQGDRVPEVSGAFFDLGKRWEGPGAGTIHTVLTSNGNSYMNWQAWSLRRLPPSPPCPWAPPAAPGCRIANLLAVCRVHFCTV